MSSSAFKPWYLAIGASGAQGLRNITALLGELGRMPDAIIMVVLHRPFDLPSRLRDVLAAATSMPVIVSSQGETLERGVVYIGEPDAHLTLLERSRGGITEDQRRLHRNRTVDLLFSSLASEAGARGIGVVLSGELDDGSRGLESIHKAGGKTMVLLRDSTHPGMPENAIGYDGPIDVIGSTETIASEVRDLMGAATVE